MESIEIFYPAKIKDNEILTTVETSETDTKDAKNVENVTSIPDTSIPYTKTAQEVISVSLDTLKKRILAEYSFSETGAIKVGKYVAGTSGEIKITPNGITAVNSSNETTFAIDGTTGDATFKGTISAGSVVTGYVKSEAGTYASATSGARLLILPDANTGLQVIDNSGNDALKVYVGGSSVGDVVIGRYSSGAGMLWDKSANTLYIKGNLVAGDIDADRITSGTLGVDRIPTITADMISATTLSAITANLGTVTAGTINASLVTVQNLSATNITSGIYSVGGTGNPTYLTIKRDDSLGSNAYLRFEGGSKMWADSANRIGINSLGSPMYIYVNSTERFAIPSSGQTTIRGGVYSDGNLNVVGDARIHDGYKLKLYSNSTQYIESDSDDMKYYTYDNHEFYINGSIKAIIDNNIWTDGSLYADGSKPFLIKHPDGSDRLLRYTAQESPDVSLRYRGVGKLHNKLCEIPLPKHFALITEKKGLVTVNLTPLSDTRVWVVSAKNNRIIVGGSDDTKFHFEVIAIRKGYLNAPVEIDKNSTGEDLEIFIKHRQLQKKVK